MANKKNYTLKIAGPDDPIYKQGFQVSTVSFKNNYTASKSKEVNNGKSFKNNYLPKA